MSKKSRKWKESRDKRDSGPFLQVPISVYNSQAYLSCDAHARMLLWDLFAQYRGNNNGDLCAAFSMMKERGWKSTHTLQKAKKTLQDVGLIVETRKGMRPNKATLYAVTWYALDECGGKLDISARGFPQSAYKLMDPPPRIGISPPLNARGASCAP